MVPSPGKPIRIAEAGGLESRGILRSAARPWVLCPSCLRSCGVFYLTDKCIRGFQVCLVYPEAKSCTRSIYLVLFFAFLVLQSRLPNSPRNSLTLISASSVRRSSSSRRMSLPIASLNGLKHAGDGYSRMSATTTRGTGRNRYGSPAQGSMWCRLVASVGRRKSTSRKRPALHRTTSVRSGSGP